MARLVGSFACSHGPNIAREWSRLKPETRGWIETRFGEMGRRLKALAPDVLVVHCTDHWINFFLDNMPTFCVGIGEEHDGPPEPFMKPVFPHAVLPGHEGLGRHLLRTALAADFDPAWSRRLKLDHGICVPVWRFDLDPIPPIVPVLMNLVEEPFPSPRRCIAWGRMVREAVESYPEDLRVVVMGTGGLSHSIGEITMGWIDEPFDDACIELFRSAPDDEIAAKLEEMLATTGNGGAEMRCWAIAHAAAGSGGFDLIDYIPMPEALIGCGLAEWRIPV